MQNEERPSRTLPAWLQAGTVATAAAIAGVAVAMIALFGGQSGLSQTPQPASHPANFIPTEQQRASLRIQAVATRTFHTEIVTDGYVAPNGGFTEAGLSSEGRIAHGLPLLSGQSSDVLQAESDLVTAKAQFHAAQASEKRQHALYNTDGAALKDWQQAQVDLMTAAASLASARNRLRVFGKSEAEIAAFEKRGPADPNMVFSVGDSSTVWLIANVREADAGLIHLGDPVDVHVPAFAGESFRAAITYVAPVIDPATHRLVVGAAIRNAGARLKPNMQATFAILAGQTTQAPAVPQNAVIYEGEAARVWVLGPNDNLALRAIKVGRTNGNYVEVTAGLSAGEQIVTSGPLFLDQAASSG